MVEPKISLSLLVPGAGMLSSQECEKNPKDSYEENRLPIVYYKGKGKNQKKIKKLIIFQTRKNKLITQNINISKEAYEDMLNTPTSVKLAKAIKYDVNGEVIVRTWDTMSIDERLKKHFDLIAHDLHAVSYSYEILGD